MPEPEFSLREATARALEAAAAGDLNKLAQALKARESAIEKASPSEQAAALKVGEAIARLLTDVKQSVVAEHNRLEQIRQGFARYRAGSGVDLIG
jgi:hypothetical protein